VRAGVIEGRLELSEGNDATAIRAFERVARHDIEFLPEILRELLGCYERRGEGARARGFLQEMIEHYPGVSPMLALAELIQRDEGIPAAQAFLARQLQQRPTVRGEAALIELSLANPEDDKTESLRTLKQITDQMVVRTNSYRCQRCGFSARAHHWQCPSCKHWGTIKPLHTAAGD
jgi:lipopolysaccharide biosynthesis regulator YciM